MIKWNKENTPEEIQDVLVELGRFYDVKCSDESNVNFVKVESIDSNYSNTFKNDGAWTIEYTNLTSFLRGINSVLSDLSCKSETKFSTFGVMIDCSRNKVLNIDTLKKWIRNIALSGGNLILLYTEDTYELEGEPFFGYLRGAFSFEEIRELDDYAYMFGVELRACFQTLGHLSQILHWPYYNDVRDTSTVLDVSKENTYKLIEKMLDFWSRALRTRKIHIGMDETQDLGRGNYLNHNGFEEPFKLYCNHLNKVHGMCKKLGLKLEIWSDMFYRFSNPWHSYYSETPIVNEDIKLMIPKGVKMWYWDYYNTNEEVYNAMVKSHKEINNGSCSMAGGLWTWSKFWCDTTTNKRIIVPMMNSCKKEQINELIFTMWGDDGGYCLFDSAFPDFIMAAEYAYGTAEKDVDGLASKRTKAICGMDYDLSMALGTAEDSVTYDDKNIAPRLGSILWDDPLIGIYYTSITCDGNNVVVPELISRFDELSAKALSCSDDNAIRTMGVLLSLLSKKLDFMSKFRSAYSSKDKDTLKKIAGIDLPEIIKLHDEFCKMYREDWYSTSKVFGFEVIQLRNAGVRARYEEVILRINEYLSGKISEIAELSKPLSYNKTFNTSHYHTFNYPSTI